jgi:hypothetical protein
VAHDEEAVIVEAFVTSTRTDDALAYNQEDPETRGAASGEKDDEEEDKEEKEEVEEEEAVVVEEEVEEEVIVESIMMDFTFEVLEQVARELAKSKAVEASTVESKVKMENEKEKGKEEELLVMEEEVVVSAQDDADSMPTMAATATSPGTSAATSPATSPRTCLMTGVNFDAPLPPLPEFEPLVPVPVLRPFPTSPTDSRPKKEMKRITRAFQKEKWMIKPRSSKTKKGNNTLPVEEMTTMAMPNQVMYNHATTLGEEDAIFLHDQDTLSVKSFDSDISL